MKKMIVIFTSLLIIFTLASCGKNEEKPPLMEESIVLGSAAPHVQGKPEETESETEIRQWAESLNLKLDTEEILAGTENMQAEGNKINLSGIVPEELEYIPDEYKSPSKHPGTLEKLVYQTWESFSYEEQTQELTKEAWVYLPYGYSEYQK